MNRADMLDTSVTEPPLADLLQPDRLRATLASLWALRAEHATSEGKPKRFYPLGEGDDEPENLLNERFSASRAERDLVEAGSTGFGGAIRIQPRSGPN